MRDAGRKPDLTVTVTRTRGVRNGFVRPEQRIPLWFPAREVRKEHADRLLSPRDYLDEPPAPPMMGWRHAAWQCGMRGIRPGHRELRHRDWARRLRRPLRDPVVVAVFSPKGGVGKSTTALQVGQVLARLRGDLVSALDANPDSGNLVKRVPEPYSPATAGDLHRDRARVARYADLVPYLTQPDTGLCVIRSDPAAATRLGPREYREILGLLTRFYSLVVVDLGTGMREPAFQSILEISDAVVAVGRATFDTAEVLAEGLDWLSGRYPAKIAAATLVLNAVGPGRDRVHAARLADRLGVWVGDVAQVPYDPHLAIGGVPRWPLLARPTQDAYLRLTAGIIGALPGTPPAVRR